MEAEEVKALGGVGSLIDLIREEQKEIEQVEDVYIRVTGYEKSGLAVRYRLPNGGTELDKIARKVERETKDRWQRNVMVAIDTMILLCEGLYVMPPGVDEWVELDPEEVGYPMRFDNRLAKMIGMDETAKTRQIVIKLFGGKGHEFAIINHSEKLNRWLMDTKADLETELWQRMGE